MPHSQISSHQSSIFNPPRLSVNTPFSIIADAIRAARRIGAVSHLRPDGDALGSLLGLTQSLALAGKEVIAISQDGVPWHLEFMPGSDKILKPDGQQVLDIDLAIALDTATADRIGQNSTVALSAASMLINIDHHGSNPRYGHLNYIDSSAPAVGEIVYDFLKAEGFPMNDSVRQNLFVAISTDTGSFRYSSTSAHTHQVVAEMMSAGLDTARLATLLYSQNPMRRVELLRTMLNEMEFRADNRIASWNYPQSTKARIGVEPGDTEGLIDNLRCIDSVLAAVIFEETRDGSIRVSARSKSDSINVANVCAQFGGGGHKAAAGATLSGPINQAAFASPRE
jgi:bifunctional oligoribonuclease and PAP phosphatase NrnA